MRKTTTSLFCLAVLAMCALPLLLLGLGINSPNLEKRVLSPRPALVSADGSLNGEFMLEVENYVADHFPLRTYLISAWHQMNISLLGQTGNNKVILGKNKWLFFSETASSYLGLDLLTDAEYARLDTILRLQAEFLESRGIHFLYTVAPNKNTVYPGRMPDRYCDQTNMNALAVLPTKIDATHYSNLRDLLHGKADNEGLLLYHRTDSHWNNRGALIACSELLNRIGSMTGTPLVSPFDGASYEEITDWTGDLAVMLFPSGPAPDIQQYYEAEQAFRYIKPLKSLEDMLIMTEGSGNGSMLMFRDSFANALIPMMSGAMESVTYSRAVPYDYSLLDNMPFDIVLLEIVERNLRNWIETPPRMPAIAYDGEVPADTGAYDDTIKLDTMVKAERDQTWLKITGQLSGLLIRPDWTTVLVTIGQTTYEAFPVTSDGQDGAAGFVLYLDGGQWQAGAADIGICLKNGEAWVRTSINIDLP